MNTNTVVHTIRHEPSDASRRGKGVHAAADRYQAWAQTYRYVSKVGLVSSCVEQSG
ncbi:MAG: hypothetical protein AB7G48_05915 [Nitrospiraceae bacterium]